MDKSQCKHYPSRHKTDAGKYIYPVQNSFPGTYHNCRITEIQEVIPCKQHPVNKTSKSFIFMQQAKNIYPPITVKIKPDMYCYYISDEEIKNISNGIHNIILAVINQVSYSTKIIIF